MDFSGMDLFTTIGLGVIVLVMAVLLFLLVQYLMKGNDGGSRDKDIGT